MLVLRRGLEKKSSTFKYTCVTPPPPPPLSRQVSNKMGSGEWVYLCVQDLQTGHVITLHDNRALLMAQAQAGSDEEKNAFRKMLGQ